MQLLGIFLERTAVELAPNEGTILAILTSAKIPGGLNMH
jgi:hypothetical protein